MIAGYDASLQVAAIDPYVVLFVIFGGILLAVISAVARAWIWLTLALLGVIPILLEIGSILAENTGAMSLFGDLAFSLQLVAPATMVAFAIFGPRRLGAYAPAWQRIRATRWFAGGCALIAGVAVSVSLIFEALIAAQRYEPPIALYAINLFACLLISVTGTMYATLQSVLHARWLWIPALVVSGSLAAISFCVFVAVDGLLIQSLIVLYCSIVASVVTLGLFAFGADRHITQREQKEMSAHATDLLA